MLFFPFRNDFEVGDAPSSIAVGLFNADSNFDLAVANSDDHTVSILLGNGDGTFTHAAKVEVDTAPSSIAVGDFNNDSNSDLAVAAFFNTGVVSIRLGNGDGTFTDAPRHAVADQGCRRAAERRGESGGSGRCRAGADQLVRQCDETRIGFREPGAIARRGSRDQVRTGRARGRAAAGHVGNAKSQCLLSRHHRSA